MKIIEVQEREQNLLLQLLVVWEQSVRETHLFLSYPEIEHIKKYVPEALRAVSNLLIAMDDEQHPVAFMGIENEMLEMLFIAPEHRGKGLLNSAIHHYDVKYVTVNEQNPQAIGFYEHLGFKVYNRTDNDEQGNPYPLLYMEIGR